MTRAGKKMRLFILRPNKIRILLGWDWMGITSYLHISNFTKFKKSFFSLLRWKQSRETKDVGESSVSRGLKKGKNVK